MNNKLIIAAAGAGKTTFLVNEALKQQDKNVLITTYTQANEAEIRKKIIKINKCIPSNIKVQTWFSFLLQHGVRPYQGCLYDKKIKGMILVNKKSAVRYYTKQGIPVCYKESEEFEKHYFNALNQIYSDKLSKFVYRCNQESDGSVIDRITRIYPHIYIDEVQDLAGYDLELIKLLLKSKSRVLLVGDPRQVTYLTHNEAKYSKYKNGKIKEFIENEGIKTLCEIDEETLNVSYRCNELICRFASKLFPNMKKTESIQKSINNDNHEGVFLVRKKDVEKYLAKYNPVQLRESVREKVNNNYKVINFGESKGMTIDRVLIYPTNPILKWLNNNNYELKPMSRSKFYVAVTRAKYSVGIIYDYNKKTNIYGLEKFI